MGGSDTAPKNNKSAKRNRCASPWVNIFHIGRNTRDHKAPLQLRRIFSRESRTSVGSSHSFLPIVKTPLRSASVLSALLLLPALGALAQQAPKELIVRQPPAVSQYILGAGDQVAVHVVDLDEVSDRPMRIDPNGFIDLALVGRVQAGGMTIDQLRDELKGRFRRYINSPEVNINLIENQSRSVSIVGSVNSPGVHPLQGPQHLLEVISAAGGLRADAGSRVILTRQAHWGELPLTGAKVDSTGAYSTATLSLEGLMAASSPSDNILIDPGDVISIPKADVVYAIGNVKRAGGFPLSAKDSMSVLQALSLAEGLSSNAEANHARILRPAAGGESKVKEIPVDINAILHGKSPDLPLYANDVLYVPNSVARAGAKRSAEAILQVATGVLVYRR